MLHNRISFSYQLVVSEPVVFEAFHLFSLVASYQVRKAGEEVDSQLLFELVNGHRLIENGGCCLFLVVCVIRVSLVMVEVESNGSIAVNLLAAVVLIVVVGVGIEVPRVVAIVLRLFLTR